MNSMSIVQHESCVSWFHNILFVVMTNIVVDKRTDNAEPRSICYWTFFDLYCFKRHYGLLYLGCQGKFLFFSRSERTFSDSKSTVENKKKSSGRTIREPHFHAIKLGQNLSLLADWKLCSRELLIGQIEKPVLKSCYEKQRDFGQRRKG